MNRAAHIHELLKGVECPTFPIRFSAALTPAGTALLTGFFLAPDVSDPNGGRSQWQTRRWVIEADDSDEQIVRTAFLLTMQAIEHEVRESFSFNGLRLFNPHERLT